MAEAGLVVTGVDSSPAMLARLAERDPSGAVEAICGDMVDALPDGPFDAVLVAYNTIFNLLDEATQQRCFTAVADRLAPGGAFVVEAFVPDVTRRGATPTDVSVRSLAVDRVVLSVTVNDAGGAASRRPVRRVHRDRRRPVATVVDPLGDPGAARRDGRAPPGWR